MEQEGQELKGQTIAVIGTWESIYGFGALGMQLYPAENPADAAEQFQTCCGKKVPLIYITEQYMQTLEQEIAAKEEQAFPIIIPIPGQSGNAGIGVARIREGVVQAIGADILFSQNTNGAF